MPTALSPALRDPDALPVSVQDAGQSLLSAFDELAGSEALTRALVCQRTEQTEKARFWVDVYRFVLEKASA